jgi:hypothetical protein
MFYEPPALSFWPPQSLAYTRGSASRFESALPLAEPRPSGSDFRPNKHNFKTVALRAAEVPYPQ